MLMKTPSTIAFLDLFRSPGIQRTNRYATHKPPRQEPPATPEEKAKALWELDAMYDGRRAQEWGTFELFDAYYKANEAGRISIYSGSNGR